MSMDVSFSGLILGALWGGLVAYYIHHCATGRWMASQVAWLLYTFAALGGLILMLLLTDGDGRLYWRDIAEFILGSLVGINALGIHSLYGYFKGMMGDANQDKDSEQDTVGHYGHYQ